jgi:general secretion pathway protein J
VVVMRRNGFTLLELLVALAVFGLLLVGLTKGMQYGLLAWQSQVRVGGSSEDLDAVDPALRQMIAVMDPGDSLAPPSFAGSRDRMEFVTVLPDAAAGLPVRRVEAGLLVDSSRRLVLRWRPWMHAARLRPVPPPVETELLRGVQGLELAFWRPGAGWVDRWRNEDLPALIRIRVLFSPGDLRHWPDIVAAPILPRP